MFKIGGIRCYYLVSTVHCEHLYIALARKTFCSFGPCGGGFTSDPSLVLYIKKLFSESEEKVRENSDPDTKTV